MPRNFHPLSSKGSGATDSAGNALAGATVIVKGTRTGTSTNEIGEFSIQSPKAAGILVISYTGFTSREIPFSGNATLDIKLSAADNRQSDIVVIGYGTQRKGDLTAPITTVNMDDVDKRTTATPMDALQGSVPGVQVISNGAPGTSPEVRIRGIGSFNK